MKPAPSVELVNELSPGELNDLCDATDEAIKAGGGFGWVRLPAREILERYWQGVLTMPARLLFVARLDNVICGTAQLITPPKNNEAQSFSCTLTTNFLAPWARGHGLARMLQHPLTDIRTDHLDAPVHRHTALHEQHGNGVRLLTRGTASAPDAQGPVPLLLLVSQQFRYDLVRKCLQLERLAEEVRFICGQDIHDIGEFLIPVTVVLEELIVFSEGGELMCGKTPCKAFFKQVP